MLSIAMTSSVTSSQWSVGGACNERDLIC